MIKKEEKDWKPTWYTIPEFEQIIPVDIFHKELEEINSQELLRSKKTQNIHVLVRSVFDITDGENPFCLKITADDHYKLYLDGTFITEGPADGYPSNYYYNKIKLGKLTPGKHIIALHIYYQGLINRLYTSGDLRFAFAVELVQNGKEIPLLFRFQDVSDCYHGDTIGYDTQFLENFDSRRFPADWKKLDFFDLKWKEVVVATWADYHLVVQPVKMLSYQEKIPKILKYQTNGTIFLDLGCEMTGSICLVAEGKAGDTVSVFCGEELLRGYQVRYDMRCNCRYQETWTLSEGENCLEPYEYKGFRYARICPAKGVVIKKIICIERHYPMSDDCLLHTSDLSLNRIFEICKNAVRIGTQDRYIDCPTREKGQYLGDAIITAHAQVLLSGETDMLLKCIDQFAQTEAICHGLLAVAPGSLMQEIADFSLLYPELLWLYYRFTGEKEMLEKYLPVIENMLAYFAGYEREDGLLEQVKEKWNLVDWPENLRDGYDFELTRPVVAAGCHNVVNALYIGARKRMNVFYEILGKEKRYQVDTYIQAFHKAFYRKKSGLYADSETSNHMALHSNVYPLYFEFVSEKESDTIVSMLEQKGFSCGVMMSYYMFGALAKKKCYDVIYRLLMNEGEHSWKNMLRQEATTCFEAWGKEQKWNTSLCHPWASAPIPVIIEVFAGIHANPDTEMGFEFLPQIPEELSEFWIQIPFRGNLLKVEKKENKGVLYIVENTRKEDAYVISKGK